MSWVITIRRLVAQILEFGSDVIGSKWQQHQRLFSFQVIYSEEVIAHRLCGRLILNPRFEFRLLIVCALLYIRMN